MPEKPSLRELPEIGRRLCALIGTRPEEPVTSRSLRRVIDENTHLVPPERQGVLVALGICSDVLAAHEQPPDLRELTAALDAYAKWVQRGDKLRARLVKATVAALPMIETEALARQAAMDASLTQEEQSQGKSPYVWPSPESLRSFPRALLDVLPRHDFVVFWMQKMLDDLPLRRASHEVITRPIVATIAMVKALKSAGYDRPLQIRPIIKPFANRGANRLRNEQRARDNIKHQLKAKFEEEFYPTYRTSPDFAQASADVAVLRRMVDPVAALPMEARAELEALHAERRRAQEAHLRFVAGSYEGVHVVRLGPPGPEPKKQE